MSLYRFIEQHDMNFSVFIVWKKLCLAVQSPQHAAAVMMDTYSYSPKPYVCLASAERLQIHTPLWSADTCMTKVEKGWPCCIPITQLVHHCLPGVGREWGHPQVSKHLFVRLHSVTIPLMWSCPIMQERKRWTSVSADSDVFRKNTHGDTHQCKMH